MTRPVDHTVRLIKALVTHDRWTRKELAIAADWSRSRMDTMVKALHEAKAIHIDAWADDCVGRQSIAVYTLGPGRDATKRTALSGKARTAAYKERKKLAAQLTAQQVILAMARPTEGVNT